MQGGSIRRLHRVWVAALLMLAACDAPGVEVQAPPTEPIDQATATQSASISQTAPAEPELLLTSPNMRGTAVEEVQQRLIALGYDPGAVDGIYGPRTTAAVRRFQELNGLPIDGIVGQDTWHVLRDPQAQPAPPSDAATATIEP